jgi:hypothetical protein
MGPLSGKAFSPPPRVLMKHAMIYRIRGLTRDTVVRDMLIKSRPDLPKFSFLARAFIS